MTNSQGSGGETVRLKKRRTHVSPASEPTASGDSAEEKEDALHEKQENLLENIDKLFEPIGDAVQAFIHLLDEKDNMFLSLSDLQQQTKTLRSKIQDEEAWLALIRTEENHQRKSFTDAVFKANQAYYMETESLMKSEREKREILEAEVKRLTDNLESEKAKRLKSDTGVKFSDGV
ncbi:hypothetical protein R1sor_012358 [Riccia sorocarpa]|uniref:Uncharacterized protein n=1 Tax=Riccia sorocarpa TaxID=122646 RepID=A0ABD3I3J6_9MARC